MQEQILSLFTERPQMGHNRAMVVAWGQDSSVFDVHAQLIVAADLIQKRFIHTSFLLEAHLGEDVSVDLPSVDGAFEVSLRSELFCVPFVQRQRLPEADVFLADICTYCKFFDALSGKTDADLDAVWEDYYEKTGLITFRLVLP